VKNVAGSNVTLSDGRVVPISDPVKRKQFIDSINALNK
jgi:hypothetical protein